MPTVPAYTRRANIQGIPGARRTAAETDVSTGAALAREQARTSAAVGDLARGVASIATARVDKARRDADEVALLDAENQLDEFERALHDPTTGAYNIRGKASFELPDRVDDDFRKVAGEIEAGLNERQQQAFAVIRQRRGQQIGLNIRRHVSGEMQRYEGEQVEATLANAVSFAGQNARDPRRVAEELTRGESALRAYAERNGESTEATEQKVEAFRSDGHLAVIGNLIAQEDEGAASAYFEATRSEIKGDKWDEVERALAEGKLTKQAQQKTDEILRQGGTFAEQRARAKELEDPKLRDEVLRRIEHEQTVRDREDREADEARMTNAANIIDGGGNYDSIPITDRSKMSPSQRSALRNYFEQVTRGIEPETNWQRFYGLMDQAGKDPEGFASVNLLNYRDKLSDTEFKQLASLQLSIRNGETDAAARVLEGVSTNTQIVNSTLEQYGIDPSDEDNASAVAQLRRMLDRRVAAAQAGGRKVTEVEIQEALDGILSQSVTTPGSWWNIIPGGKPFFDRTKRLIEYTIDDVPEDKRREIEAARRARGLPVTPQTIVDTYVEMQVK